MEWPYDNDHRGFLPPDSHSLTFNELHHPQPSLWGWLRKGQAPAQLYWQQRLRQKYCCGRTRASLHRNYLRLGSRSLPGRQDKYMGTLGAAPVRLRLQSQGPRRLWRNWPISYSDIAPYYDKVDLYLGITGVKENLPYLPDSIFQRPTKLNCAELTLKQGIQKMDRVLTQYRAGVTSEGLKHNKYRRPMLRARRMRTQRRLRHSRRVRFSDRPDLSRDGHRQSDFTH